MTLKELKDWVNSLPDNFLDYHVVNGEVRPLDDDYEYCIDKPITTLTVDIDTEEILILNDSVEDGELEPTTAH